MPHPLKKPKLLSPMKKEFNNLMLNTLNSKDKSMPVQLT
jgi:hypothetical protein